MARGPRGERRPDDPAAAAVMTVRLATGEISESLDESATLKDPAAVELGRRGGLKGGFARAASLSSEQRHAIAKKAARKRWGSDGGPSEDRE